jgi:hypothetical protein
MLRAGLGLGTVNFRVLSTGENPLGHGGYTPYFNGKRDQSPVPTPEV